MAEGTPTGQVLAHGLHVPSLGQKRERRSERNGALRPPCVLLLLAPRDARYQARPYIHVAGKLATACTPVPFAFIT